MKVFDRRLAGNIASLLILQGAGYLLPLITLPYLARVLLPQGFGKVAIAQALAMYGAIVVDWGFNLSATQDVARCQHDQLAVSRLLWSTTAARALLAVALLVLILLALVVPSLRPYASVLLASWMVTFSGVLFPLFVFRGMERMGPVTWINILSRLATIPLVFILIKSPSDYLKAIYIQALSGLLIGILSWTHLLQQHWVTWYRPRRADISGCLARGWPIFFSNAAISLYTVSNTVLLGIVSNSQSVGIFSAADKLRSAAQGLWGPVTQAVFPRAANLAAQDKAVAMTFLRKYALWCVGINGSISIGILVTAPWLVPLLFGPGYEQVTPVLQLLSALPLLIGLSNLFGIQTMLPFGMQKQFSRILVASAIINVALLLALGKLFRAEGAAAAVTITEFIVTAAMYIVLRQRGIVFWGKPNNEQ